MTTIAPLAPVVNFDLATLAPDVEPDADDYRPTYDFSYYPDFEEERDAREMFADEDDDEPSDAEWDARADDALAVEMACSGHWAF